MYENLCKLKFAGGAFTDVTTLPLFKNPQHRMGVIYGRNGSGKSTIARAFEKINGEDNSDIISAELLDKDNKYLANDPDSPTKIHVFSEDYIQKNVRLKEEGLATIVMFGAQGELDDQIHVAEKVMLSSKEKKEHQEGVCEQYADYRSVVSPEHFLFEMNLALSGDNHWAGRERYIWGLRRNSSVNNETYKKIVEDVPPISEDEVITRYSQQCQLLQAAREGNAKITDEVPQILPEKIDEGDLADLLGKEMLKPELTEREKYLLTLVETGKLQEMQDVFSHTQTTQCPFCLQPITQEYKEGLIESIRKILTKEVEEHKNILNRYLRGKVAIELSPYNKLAEELVNAVQTAVEEFNQEVDRCNSAIQQKIDDPFHAVRIDGVHITNARRNLEQTLEFLEKSRIEYNKQIADVVDIQRKLAELNKYRAYFEISQLYENYRKQDAEKTQKDAELEKVTKEYEENLENLGKLIDKKKNISIAVDMINRNLRYVFFSDNRLAIKANDGAYTLLSRGRAVKPSEISVGERNAIALCYFFADMLSNQNVDEGYREEMLVVIDDPISSFDFENKVGIMSFLRAQILKIMEGNRNTKLIILTHDLPIVYDFDSVFEEVKKIVSAKSGGKCDFALWELKGKQTQDFGYKKRHEYSEMLKAVYRYARNQDPEYELTIGNTMRRVLETFSTFVYREGMSQVSCDEKVLKQLKEPEYISYFGNLMYRLVLNGESHMEERAKTVVDPDFMSAVAPEEKCRAAQAIICFIYLLNPVHVMAHLEDERDADKTIEEWCNKIKEFDQSKE